MYQTMQPERKYLTNIYSEKKNFKTVLNSKRITSNYKSTILIAITPRNNRKKANGQLSVRHRRARICPSYD